MVHYVNGQPTDSLIYRKTQYYPKCDIRTAPQPRCNCGNTTIIHQAPRPSRAMNAGAVMFGLGALFAPLGTLIASFIGIRGNRNAAQTQQAAQSQTTDYTQQMANLKTLFPSYNFVSDGDGKFRATDSAGKLYGPADYSAMCTLLQTPSVTPIPTQQPTDVTPPTNTGDGTPTVDRDKSTVPQNNTQLSTNPEEDIETPTQTVVNQSVEGSGEWTDAKKAEYNKPVKVQFILHPGGFASRESSAIITMPDGKVYTASFENSGTSAKTELTNRLLAQIHDAGWTNVTTLQAADGSGFKNADIKMSNYNADEIKAMQVGTINPADAGFYAAENLVGVTSASERAESIRLITAQTPATIKAFIVGYNGNKGVFGDYMMEQICTEKEWSGMERNSSYRSILSNVLEATKNSKNTGAREKLQGYLDKLKDGTQTLSKDDAIECDKLINQLIYE